ncbi:MAG: ribonuclease III [Caldilineales bacterium]
MTNDSFALAANPLLDATRRFEKSTGIAFRDKTLLQRALTHRSYVNESRVFLQADNERLEFLGDAVIDFVVGEQLYHRFPEMREGKLTNLRAALVREETLADFAREIHLGDFLQLGRGESDSGGRERPAILCAVFEAVVGALFLDQGVRAVKQFMFPLVEPVLPDLVEAAAAKDAKSRLQEWSQSEFRETPRYHTVDASGPDHEKTFTVAVSIGGTPWGVGVGHSKQQASQLAAAQALEHIDLYAPSGTVPIPQLDILATESDEPEVD